VLVDELGADAQLVRLGYDDGDHVRTMVVKFKILTYNEQLKVFKFYIYFISLLQEKCVI